MAGRGTVSLMTEPIPVDPEQITDDALAAIPGTPPHALDAGQVLALVKELRRMDHQQQTTDEFGGAELAWYYWRGDIERLLGLDPGALNMSKYVEEPWRPGKPD